MSLDSATNKWYLEGITSYVIVLNDFATGEKKCDINEPNFFTFVAKYRDLIEKHLYN